jgi:hypothetical protein
MPPGANLQHGGQELRRLPSPKGLHLV